MLNQDKWGFFLLEAWPHSPISIIISLKVQTTEVRECKAPEMEGESAASYSGINNYWSHTFLIMAVTPRWNYVQNEIYFSIVFVSPHVLPM